MTAPALPLGAERPRLLVVEGIVLSSPADPYLALRALVSYSGCSIRWLRDRLADPHHPLPCYRVAGKILVRRSEWDAWITRYRAIGHQDANRVIAETLAGLR